MRKIVATLIARKNFLDYILIFFLGISTLPIFFYRLGESSLASWDEGWHAVIARHVLETGNLFHLVYNGTTFSDHPPGGYWIIAGFFKIFGVNEFSDRLIGGVLGFWCLVLVYSIGKVLFNRIVGLASALGLFSSIWFLYRARSGNLDIPLTFFFLLTIYLAIKALGNRKYFWGFSLSLAYLILIKAALPLTIFPALVVIFFPNRLFKFKLKVAGFLKKIWSVVPKDLAFSLNKKTYSLKDFFLPFGLIALFLGGWYQGLSSEGSGAASHFISHGARGTDINSFSSEYLQRTLTFLHNGIGKWYWPGLASVILTPLIFQKRFWLLSVFAVSYLLPFLFSPEGELWHLIPVYPILILSFFGFLSFLIELGFNLLRLKLKFLKPFYLTIGMAVFVLGIAGYYGFIQSRANWYNFVSVPPYFTDQAILAREASLYPQELLIDDDFLPVALFYSHKKEVVKIFREELDARLLSEKSFLLITNDWRLKGSTVSASLYRIIKADRDKVLILKP